MENKKLIILGSGPGGYIPAVRAAQLGFSVTVVEQNRLGGVCLQHGCVPVKALLASARIFESARGGEPYGVTVENIRFDYSKMAARKNEILALNEHGIETLFKKHKVALVHGRGKLVSPSQVEVTDVRENILLLTADYTLLATGSSSAVPSFIKLDQEKIFDCEGALAQTSLPESIIILGGGILGCEFASLYNTLGAKVTIIEKLDSLIPTWDTDLSKALITSFKKRGITIRTGIAVENIRNGDTVIVTLSDKNTITAERCLVALGRKPNIENIGLDETGITLWKETYRGIQVNEYMQTNISNIYAVGDVNGVRPLAHVASTQGITAVEHMAGIATPMKYDAIPDCYWADPELASVGLTEQETKTQGLAVSIGKVHYRALGISHILGKTDGFVKIIAEKTTGKILGIHICGHSAPDMIAEAGIIVTNGLTLNDVKRTIHAHPTMGEIIKEAVLAVGNENIHG